MLLTRTHYDLTYKTRPHPGVNASAPPQILKKNPSPPHPPVVLRTPFPILLIPLFIPLVILSSILLVPRPVRRVRLPVLLRKLRTVLHMLSSNP